MILIDLYDTDVINTLVPVFSLKPDLEYMVVDRKNSNTRLFKSIVKTIGCIWILPAGANF